MQREFYKTLFFFKNFVILFRLELAAICRCKVTTLPFFCGNLLTWGGRKKFNFSGTLCIDINYITVTRGRFLPFLIILSMCMWVRIVKDLKVKEVQADCKIIDPSAKDYLLKGQSAFLSGLSAIDLQSRSGGRKL